MREEYQKENLKWYVCPECGNEEEHEADWSDTCWDCWSKERKNVYMIPIKKWKGMQK